PEALPSGLSAVVKSQPVPNEFRRNIVHDRVLFCPVRFMIGEHDPDGGDAKPLQFAVPLPGVFATRPSVFEGKPMRSHNGPPRCVRRRLALAVSHCSGEPLARPSPMLLPGHVAVQCGFVPLAASALAMLVLDGGLARLTATIRIRSALHERSGVRSSGGRAGGARWRAPVRRGADCPASGPPSLGAGGPAWSL